MIGKLQQILRKHIGQGEVSRDDDAPELQLATATLLMEVASADNMISEEERQDVRRLIEHHFALSPELTQDIASSAERKAQHSTSLYPFTRLINHSCSPEEKVRIIGMLWRVSCADGHVDKHEEYLVRKIADLLYVPHRDYIRVKLEVIDGQAPDNPGSPRGDGALVNQEK
ncbi:MAG: TerB family tellurite resistance protein [Gammaproteobacteria bacterium]